MIINNLTVLLLCLSSILTNAQSFLKISGTIVDASSNEPLPFAGIGFISVATGTVSNEVGYFQLNYPETLKNEPLSISYMGYETFSIIPSQFSNTSTFRLKPIALQLDEVIIYPLDPEDYIRKAVRNFTNALPKDPFRSQSYYQEMISEDGQYVDFTECVFKSYYPAYQDTTKSQHQLLLYRKEKNPHKIAFMREKIDKEKAQERKKAAKNGEEYVDNEQMLVEATFGGPGNILSMDLLKYPEPFLDSTKFKRFQYQFEAPVIYQGNQLLSISFEATKTVDHLVHKGIIYIDLHTNAIIKAEYTARVVIPAYVKPLLFLYGLSVSNLTMTKSVRYQAYNGRWYPDYFFLFIKTDLEKRHLFSPNEKSHFELNQRFKVNEISLDNLIEIPKEKIYDPKRKISEQAYPVGNLEWADVNIVAK